MNRVKKILKCSTCLLLFFLGSHLHASERLPFNSRLKTLIEDTFYQDGQPSPGKITRYLAHITRRYQEVKNNLQNLYILKKKNSKEQVYEQIKEKDEIKAYNILLETIEQLKTLMERKEDEAFQHLALRVLELDYALKVEGKKLFSLLVLEKVVAILKERRIPIHSAPGGEASNLVNPETGRFYNQEELRKFKRRGVDISRLNPPSDSTFWTDHAISRIDIKTHYQTGRDALHKGLEIIFPGEKAYFQKVRKSQANPNIDLFFPHQGQALQFRLKIGSEVHSEITCASLYAALGFSADSCKYVRDFKVVLGDVPHHVFRREWESYYSGYNLDKYVKQQGKDSEGYYIVFYEGVLKARPGQLIRVGPWAYSKNGNEGRREVRGSLIFHMWVANFDLKEAEKNKLMLRKVGDQYKCFHIQQDMGFAFGRTYTERPGSFKWKLVRKKTRNYISMYYRCFQENSLFKHVSYADARWMVRLIARLTRKQITDAVALGGWPESIQKLLVEKLISRRNQLVKAFKLVGEKTTGGGFIDLLPFNPYISTPDGVVKNGKFKVYEFEGYPQYFGPRLNEIFLLAIRGLRNMAVDTSVRLISAVRFIEIQPEWLGLDKYIVSKIIVRLNREIQRNPYPVNDSESFLVKDTMEIGLRLGYGYVVSGDVAYTRKYTLVYPVQTKDAGRFHDKFILNLFLPFKRRARYLPRNHVVIFEDFLEGRGQLRLRPHGVPLECRLTASKIYLRRFFLSFKNHGRAVFFDDRSLYDEMALRLFLEFLRTFRFPFFEGYIQNGRLHRDYVEMDISDLETNPRKQEALDQVVLQGNPGLLKALGKQNVMQLTDRFFEKKGYFTFFGFLRKRSVFRVDRLEEQAANHRHYLQVESRKLKEWNFVDNGERHYSSIKITGQTNDQKSLKESLLRLSFRINDESTHDGELKKGYLFFINTLAQQGRFIDFDPTRHTVNRLWGPTQVFVDVLLYEEGIRNVIYADEEKIWQALAEITGKSVDFWKRMAKPRYVRGRPKVGRYSRDRYLAIKTRYFIKVLRRARVAGSCLGEMRQLVKAVRKAVYTSGQTFDPLHLAIIHRLAGEENIFMTAFVTIPENRENVFPARGSLYNQMGMDRGLRVPEFQFIFDDPSEIYHLF